MSADPALIPDVATLSTEVSWYDGVDTYSAKVTVSPMASPEDIIDPIDLSRIPLADVQQIKCVNISSPDNISTLHNMQVLDQNGQYLVDVGQLYDGALYPIGGNWYGFILPNGYEQPLLLRIGDSYFNLK